MTDLAQARAIYLAESGSAASPLLVDGALRGCRICGRWLLRIDAASIAYDLAVAAAHPVEWRRVQEIAWTDRLTDNLIREVAWA